MSSYFDQADATFPFGAHIAVVEVDSDTGQVRSGRHVAVDDCGTVINPLLVEGQQHGGIAAGRRPGPVRGGALRRRRQPDHRQLRRLRDAVGGRVALASRCTPPRRRRRSTRSAPRASARRPPSAPPRRCRTPSSTPLAHLGVRHIDMPCTPERVWRAIARRPRRHPARSVARAAVGVREPPIGLRRRRGRQRSRRHLSRRCPPSERVSGTASPRSRPARPSSVPKASSW